MHQDGLQVREAMSRAREQVAQLIGAGSPDEIIFTSNGTEAANLAVKGVAEAARRRGQHIVTSAIEHPAVLRSIEHLEASGFTCARVPVDSVGRIDPEQIRGAITEATALICVHHANYDIGTVQRIEQICLVAADRGIPVFVDASQSGGWLEIDVAKSGVNLLSLSPHRFYGPKGVGVLYRNRGTRITPLLHGGIQEDGRRAGTENVAAIVGAGIAAEHASRDLIARARHAGQLQERLWQGLWEKVPYVRLNGPSPGPGRISNQLNVSCEFVEGEGVMLMLDVRGVAVASGTACVSKAIKPSPVLHAIGVEDSLAQGAVIFSAGKDTSIEDIDYAIETTVGVIDRLRGMSPSWDEFRKGAIPSRLARA